MLCLRKKGKCIELLDSANTFIKQQRNASLQDHLFTYLAGFHHGGQEAHVELGPWRTNIAFPPY